MRIRRFSLHIKLDILVQAGRGPAKSLIYKDFLFRGESRRSNSMPTIPYKSDGVYFHLGVDIQGDIWDNYYTGNMENEMIKMREMNAIVDEAVTLRRSTRGKWSIGRVVLEIAEKYNLSDEEYRLLYRGTEFWSGSKKK